MKPITYIFTYFVVFTHYAMSQQVSGFTEAQRFYTKEALASAKASL
jgi:hypothetical protein